MMPFNTRQRYCHLLGLLVWMTVLAQSDALPDFTSYGGNFGKGRIDLGGLSLCQSSTFNRVLAINDVRHMNRSVTFFEPSGLPDGCFMLGHYSQVTNKFVDGLVLGVIDEANGAVAKPVNYTLIWSNENENLRQNSIGYVWLPVPPKGYMALGHIVTTTSAMPSLEKVRCVRANFTRKCSARGVISEQWEDEDSMVDDIPITVGIIEAAAKSLPLDVFGTQKATEISSTHCFKTTNAANITMPNLDQVKQLMTTYGPLMHFHLQERYYPSTVNWFFSEGALLFTEGKEEHPKTIEPEGANLPTDGSHNQTFWLDLPINGGDEEQVKSPSKTNGTPEMLYKSQITDSNPDQLKKKLTKKEKTKKGDLRSARAYLHVKSSLGGIISDFVIWLFYPFKGPAIGQLGHSNGTMGQIGTRVGDWEHVTVRISNLDAKLVGIYFANDSGGQWVYASDLEYTNNTKPTIYASRYDHSLFPHANLTIFGNTTLGLQHQMGTSGYFMDLGAQYDIISADYLGVKEPAWLNYRGRWGPMSTYSMDAELKKLRKYVHVKQRRDALVKFLKSLPPKVLRQGLVGPKFQGNWIGDPEA